MKILSRRKIYLLNPLSASVTLIKKPVNWFAQQINWQLTGFYMRATHWHLMDNACVRFFFTKWWPLNNYQKLFSFPRYSNFCISVFPSFFPIGHYFRAWSNINLKVYGVISCVNKNLITHFVWYLKNEKGMTLKLCQLIEYYLRNIFIEKSCRKCAAKASPRSLFNFV